MLIRKNTKAFKTILEIVITCQDRPDRDKLIRLYITKAGHSIEDRINVEGIQGESGLFYEMTYQTVLSNLQSSNHQLCVSDDVPGIYFFHSTSNKVWDEAPFEFDEAIKAEFSSLAELPAVRKKEKTTKFDITGPKEKSESSQSRKEKSTPSKTKADTDKAKPNKAQVALKGPKQPDFGLKHEIHFSNLDKIIFRDPKLDKRGILEYYNEISEDILPYLKDRSIWTKRDTDALKPSVEMTVEAVFKHDEDELPRWMKTHSAIENKQKKNKLLCNDKEHLLFFVETGSLQFDHGLAKVRNHDTPDYLVIGIDSPEFDVTKAVDVALATNEILEGLQLRSCPKTDGVSGFHIYISLETTSTFDTSYKVAEYLCKLIGLKIPERVSLIGSESHGYGKVTLDYSMNAADRAIVAPYSLVPGQSTIVATPLSWDEVNGGLRIEEFNHETVFKRLKRSGDPLANLKKKINADDLLERLETHYSFLL